MSSIAATVLRTCAERALMNKTIAGDRIFDSAIAPINTDDLDEFSFVILSTEAESAPLTGHNLRSEGGASIDLVFELAIGHRDRRDGEDSIVIPNTDSNLEFLLTVLERQIWSVLQDENNRWAEAFGQIVVRYNETTSQRGVSNENGARFAARQIVLSLEPLSEPAFGQEPVGAWREVIALFKSDPDLASKGEHLENTILGVSIPDWDQFRASVGYSRRAAEALGMTSPIGPSHPPDKITDINDVS